MHKPKFSLFLASLLAVVSANTLNVAPAVEESDAPLAFDIGIEAAEARRSGGRSGGGSFSRPSRSSPSRSRGSSSGSGGSRTRSTPRPRSTPATRSTPQPRNTPAARSTPAPNSGSGGRTGGRVQGGSFDRSTPAPVPAAPNNTPTQTQPRTTQPRSTPVPVPNRNQPRGGNSYELEVDVEQPRPSNYAPVNPNVQTGGGNAPTGGAAVEAQTRRNNSGGFPVGLLLLLIIGVGGIVVLWWIVSRGGDDAPTGSSAAAVDRELSNDVVTVTKLQVALLAEARLVQSELTELSLDADLESPEGLVQFLQECAIALLRQPDYWTHARAESTTYKSREEAQKAFGELSVEERGKFTAETFSNVEGRLRQRDVEGDEDADPGEYIVVTLLVGTEDDKPLFDSVYSAEELREALKTLASLTPDYLLVFELLWTPQAETDSLTADDLLLEYSDMVQL